MKFRVLILGTDINAYYMARCYHEAYNKKADMLGKSPMAFTKHSNIINIDYEEKLWDEEVFVRRINEFAKKYHDEKIVVISSNETYARFLVKNKDYLEKNILFNYPNLEIFDNLIMKDKFYNAYHEMLDIPKTYIYSCKKKEKIKETFTFPIILKASDVIDYNHHRFPGMHKIYRLNSMEEVEDTINKIEDSGYSGNLLLQEFIPGDDSHLCDVVFYSGTDKKVKLASFAQIGLQEHAKGMVGNAAVLINGYNEYGKVEETIQKLKNFMEYIGFQGIAEFDLKYDKRDNKYKVFEINARQGRCSYYVTACGFNLVKYLVDDLVFNKQEEFIFVDKEQMLSFVPKGIIEKYVVNEKFRKKALELWRQGKVVNPLIYKKDKNFKRKLVILKKSKDYYKEYKNGDWKQ